MAVKTQDAAGYYVWEVAGKPVAVHLHLDVVDHLLAVVLRGLGALPKRGAEVGGLLLGTIEHGDVSIVRIEDFEPVECEYTRGPSYLFTDVDRKTFEAACERWRPGESRPAYAVGFYRSHTRDGMSLTPEDVELVDEFFPLPENIVLLVKPFRTKLSMAGFFFREAEAFPPKTPLEFPFQRGELAGERATQPPENGTARVRPDAPAPTPDVPARTPDMPADVLADVSAPKAVAAMPPKIAPVWQPGPAFAEKATPPPRPKLRSALWIPLSFVFLLIGLILGITLASTYGFGGGGGGIPDLSLKLSVARSDENISVKWDRQAAAIRKAERGTIEIDDGGQTFSRSLDAIELQNGSVIYRNASNVVKFRLIVYPGKRVSVAETIEWRR